MLRVTLVVILLFCAFSVSAQTEEEILHKAREIIDAQGIAFYLENVAEMSSQEFPKKMDKMDTITGMYYIEATKALTYKHVLSSDWKQQVMAASGIDASEVAQYMPELMQKNAVARACSIKLNHLYFEHGVKLVNIYADDSGAVVFTTTVKKQDCNA